MIKSALFLVFTLMIYSLSAFGFVISSVDVECMNSNCFGSENDYTALSRNYVNQGHFRKLLKLYVENNGVKKLSYEIIKKEGRHKLKIYLTQKRVVASTKVKFIKDSFFEVSVILPIKKGDYLTHEKIQTSIKLIKDIGKTNGFPETRVKIIKVFDHEEIDIIFNVDAGRPILLNQIYTTSSSSFLEKMLRKKILQFKGQAFNFQNIKTIIEQRRQVFIGYGYYLVDIGLKYKYISKNKVDLFLTINSKKQHAFHVTGNSSIKTTEIKKVLSTALISYKREMSKDNIAQNLKEFYISRGFLKPSFDIEHFEYYDERNEVVKQSKVNIIEGQRFKLEKLSFKGNGFYSREKLENLFEEYATEQANENIVDHNYYSNFTQKLRENYIEDGYVSVFVDKPQTIIDYESGNVELIYKIREGVRSKVLKIQFEGVDAELEYELKELLATKVGQSFNPILFKKDLELIKELLQNKGYYFAAIQNINSKNLVEYINDNSSLKIRLNVKLGTLLHLNKIFIIGNKKTRKKVIKREITLKYGEPLSKSAIRDFELRLLRTGLFSSVKISPISEGDKFSDVLVFLKEKDFGEIEVAPGIRSDTGLKISTLLSYNNIDGLNKKITLKANINSRLNLSSLDDRRRKEGNDLLEYGVEANYGESYLFDSTIAYNASVSKSRTRYYAFDADIQKLRNTLTYQLTDWLEFSVSHQLETISQYDATAKLEHGFFQIGSITTAFTADFRNRVVNTSSGAYFNMSLEYANPSFGSQDNEELKIDYYKLVSRNKFYVPASDFGVLAISTAFGIQENSAKGAGDDGELTGYIPNIKVFRLSGIDGVRGFEDHEINSLISQEDISEVAVTGRAYMVNIKVEPRVYLSDTMMLGIFYDAGRIFVDEFRPDKLRSSVGLSFKYITPVGTLDFDYGIKLLRKENSDGKLDAPGRLHVSIGFF